jgi:hypothetical protein
MYKNALLTAGALLLCGCATPFYDAKTAGPLLEQASRLPASSIRTHVSCQVGFAATGAGKADFAAGACAMTDTTLYLYSWDATNKRYRREAQLDFGAIKSVFRAKLAVWTQLQMPVDGGRLVFEARAIDPFLQAMQKAGVKEEPGEYISSNLPPSPTPIYIPIYVGG